jgi:hypothetical protein
MDVAIDKKSCKGEVSRSLSVSKKIWNFHFTPTRTFHKKPINIQSHVSFKYTRYF